MKRHPVITYFLTLVPVVGLSLGGANFYYTHLIASYRLQAEQAIEHVHELERKLAVPVEPKAIPEAEVNKPSTPAETANDIQEPITVKRNDSIFLFGGHWRLQLRDTIPYIERATISLLIDKHEQTLYLTMRDREQMNLGGKDYLIDLVKVTEDSATLKFTEKL